MPCSFVHGCLEELVTSVWHAQEFTPCAVDLTNRSSWWAGAGWWFPFTSTPGWPIISIRVPQMSRSPSSWLLNCGLTRLPPDAHSPPFPASPAQLLHSWCPKTAPPSDVSTSEICHGFCHLRNLGKDAKWGFSLQIMERAGQVCSGLASVVDTSLSDPPVHPEHVLGFSIPGAAHFGSSGGCALPLLTPSCHNTRINFFPYAFYIFQAGRPCRIIKQKL